MVQLGNIQEVKMCMEVEQLDFMVCYRFGQRLHKNVHYLWGHIRLVKESEVDVRCNFERVIHNAELEQFDELILCDLRQIHLQKVQIVVLLTVHLEHKVNFLWRDKEPLTVVLSNPRFNVVINKDLLIVGLVVLPVSMTLNDFLLQVENLHWNFGSKFLKCLSDKFPIPCFQEMARIFVSELHKLQLVDDL